ncbi:MAG: poly-beta-1,6-N-acetyl-D-glucosamine N-deacetylase PgaB [Gammaproteobacteria bacterium]
MKRFLLKLILPVASLLAVAGAQAGEFHVLAYHDVRKDVAGNTDDDPYAISRANLARHFEWLKQNDYQVVRVDDVLAARDGKRPLPEKAVLITFDDGSRRIYTEAYPLLKLYAYPAVVAVVTSWLEVPAGNDVAYGDEMLPREDFISWREAREMQDSGLVEFASQTHALHHDVVAAPQGTRQPAATTRAWQDGKYESLADYYRRVAADLLQSREVLLRRLGTVPRVLVWPYGAHSSVGWQAAKEQGYRLSFTLDDTRPANPADTHIGRLLVMNNPDAAELAAELLPADPRPALRVIQVDLDRVHDADAAQQARNLDALVERVRALGVGTVYLQAFADPDGDGEADALYFPNRHLPLRADLFAHAAWQLHSRAGVRVYGWLPVTAFRFPQEQPEWRVMAAGGGAAGDYRRLSFFRADVRRAIRDIYDDLGRHAYVDGLLFHDDGLLRADEDVNPAAIDYYRAHGFPEFDLARVQADAAANARWSALKTAALVDFTAELAAVVRAHRPELRTARNLFAPVVLDPAAEARFAQSLPAFAAAYDQVALMAMPQLEKADDSCAFLDRLARKVKASGVDTARVVFELQAHDWDRRQDIAGDWLAEHMDRLLEQGIVSYGYYPDDFLRDQPKAADIRPAMSVSGFPWSP